MITSGSPDLAAALYIYHMSFVQVNTCRHYGGKYDDLSATGWQMLTLAWVQGDKCWHWHKYRVTNVDIGFSTGWQMFTLAWVQGDKCWHWLEYRVTNKHCEKQSIKKNSTGFTKDIHSTEFTRIYILKDSQGYTFYRITRIFFLQDSQGYAFYRIH